MLYEFVVGTQISSRYFLDLCEVPVTEFFDLYQEATIFKQDTDQLEGFFRQWDTFTLLTPMTANCWQTYWRTGDAFRNVYAQNQDSPTQIYINMIYEFMSLFNNVTVIAADLFFEDWLSLAFYVGDTMYRLLVL